MRRKLAFGIAIFSALTLAGLSGCAHLPAGKGVPASELLADACRPGQHNQTVTGTLWMSLHSKEAKGQFPASVNARLPGDVTLEVTNLIGTREALIQVHDGKYTVDIPNRHGGTTRRSSGVGSWGGIPLRWASELFLGRVPCPSPQMYPSAIIQTTPDGELLVRNNGELFDYRFRQWAGRPWPESLHWEKSAPSGQMLTSVDFKFDKPDDKTGSPTKWEAKSPRGEVKVRWTELQTNQ